MKRHVIVHEIDDAAVQAKRTLPEWITFLSEFADDELETWDDVYDTIIWASMLEGDHTEFVRMTANQFVTTIMTFTES